MYWKARYKDGWVQYECPYCKRTHAFATEICPRCERPLKDPEKEAESLRAMTRENYVRQFGPEWH